MAPLWKRKPRVRISAKLGCHEQLQQDLKVQWDTLSMGMTNDFEVAVEEGATLVRIGSALFVRGVMRILFINSKFFGCDRGL